MRKLSAPLFIKISTHHRNIVFDIVCHTQSIKCKCMQKMANIRCGKKAWHEWPLSGGGVISIVMCLWCEYTAHRHMAGDGQWPGARNFLGTNQVRPEQKQESDSKRLVVVVVVVVHDTDWPPPPLTLILQSDRKNMQLCIIVKSCSISNSFWSFESSYIHTHI